MMDKGELAEGVAIVLGLFVLIGALLCVAVLGIWQLIDAPGIVQGIVGGSAGAAAVIVFALVWHHKQGLCWEPNTNVTVP